MRRVCWACGIELRPKKNGVAMIEMASFGPAAIWDADLWHCPDCGVEIVVGFAQEPWCRSTGPRFLAQLTTTEVTRRTRRFWLNARERDQYNERAAAAEAPRVPQDARAAAAGAAAHEAGRRTDPTEA